MNYASRIAAVLLVAAGACGCGKRGNPLPPLRPVPARISDASAVRANQTVTIKFTVPSANLDGTTPLAINRIDVFAWQGGPGAIPPAAGVIAGERRNLRSSLSVMVPPASGAPVPAPSAATAKVLAPGDAAVFVDQLGNVDTVNVATLAYVLVPINGGRSGPPSPPLVIPVAALPAAPLAVKLSHTETEVQAAWDVPAAVTGLTYRLIRTSPAGEPLVSATPAAPITGGQTTFPVEFGRELCVAVQPIIAAGRVMSEGALSRASCLTPVDRYPPPAPAAFQAVQEGAAVALSWTAVTASDLAGYTVLRGENTADNLQPLMRTPLKETTYRDTTVRPGVTYFYVVYAEDGAAPPNVSQLSNRQSVTVR